MNTFQASFEIISATNCPLYTQSEYFLLTDKVLELPTGRLSCLILVRELTSLLFSLIPDVATNFANRRDTVFTCGGCTGLIKFRLMDKSGEPIGNKGFSTIQDPSEPVISGRVEAIVPAELLQVFHMHQKTGRLIMEFETGSARVTFKEGGLLAARFEDLDNQEAVYAMLAEKRGTFHFISGLPDTLMKARELGDFMMILMEGLRRLDESEEKRL
jgi:hypothetical protein